MRHNKKINHLGRTSSHRQAMLSNMASSLIKHKRIFTTTAKAKALRKYVEPLVTKSKEDTTHSRRTVFSLLQDKYAVTELFTVVSQKVADRPGGYTRIIKTGNRLGDNAAMCFIELVDFNENMLKETKKAATKTRRSRRKSTGESAIKETSTLAEKVETPEKEVISVEEEVIENAEPVEEVKIEVPVVSEAIAEEPKEEPKAE
ncbi:MAG: 50S ribosomal protein L17 [Bacteroidales bacterium]|jgi:large subunit ribosomal protein L17|nr:50S ribosomal protein L17 [Bacteroidales bacterium]